MSATAYRQEIMAEDLEEAPGALWKRDQFGRDRIRPKPETLTRVVVAVDPTGSTGGDEVGIIASGLGRDGNVYILEDASVHGLTPDRWAAAAVQCHRDNQSDWILGRSTSAATW